MTARITRRWALGAAVLALLMAKPLVAAPSLPAHPFYVGIVEVQHNPDAQRWEVLLKLFSDDLDLAVREAGGPTLHLGTPAEAPKAAQAVDAYLKSHLLVVAGDDTLKLVQVGFQPEVDATWVGYEAPATAQPPTRVYVRCTALMRSFPTQQHLTSVNVGGNDQSKPLSASVPGHTFRF